jgi:hypothetical protein
MLIISTGAPGIHAIILWSLGSHSICTTRSLAPFQGMSFGMTHFLARWSAHITCTAPCDRKVSWKRGIAVLSEILYISSPTLHKLVHNLSAMILAYGYSLCMDTFSKVSTPGAWLVAMWPATLVSSYLGWRWGIISRPLSFTDWDASVPITATKAAFRRAFLLPHFSASNSNST